MPAQTRDVVVALNYYAPYVSGVTEAARVVAEGLAARGWQVTVVCSRHDPELPARQAIAGVKVIRTSVTARIGKGVISPSFVPTVVREARRARVLNLHLPMLEAGAVALATRGTPLLATYQCDVSLPPGALNRMQVSALDASHRVAIRHARATAVSSADYAESSRLWSTLRMNDVVIPPPCLVRDGGRPTFREGGGQHVGFLGRIVEEKGLEYLVDGFRARASADSRLLIAGEFAEVAGGSVVDRVRRHIGDDPRVRLLGFLPAASVPDFFASLDVFVLPSVNSLEAFGIVQAEAMMVGVPVIATDRPGVRTLVTSTGFGIIVPPRDSASIGTALETIQAQDLDRQGGAARARALYGADSVVDAYEEQLEHISR